MQAPPFPAAAILAARDSAKAHLRVAGDSEDALIERLAATALGLAEAFTGLALIVRDHQAILPVAGAWRALPAEPVLAITGLTGLPAEGAAFALAGDSYAIDIDAAGTGWVRVPLPGIAGRVRADYSAGLATDWAGLPAPIAQGVTLLIAHLFEAREGANPPAAVSALWRPWRRVRLAKAEHAA